MKYHEISKKKLNDHLYIETVAMFMKEEVFGEYKDCLFAAVEYDDKAYVVIFNENEKQDVLDFKLEDELQDISEDDVEYELNYLKVIFEQTISYLNLPAMKVMQKYNLLPLGSFNGRGGVRITDKETGKTVKLIKLSFIDLYDLIEIETKEDNLMPKSITVSKDLYFNELSDAIVRVWGV